MKPQCSLYDRRPHPCYAMRCEPTRQFEPRPGNLSDRQRPLPAKQRWWAFADFAVYSGRFAGSRVARPRHDWPKQHNRPLHRMTRWPMPKTAPRILGASGAVVGHSWRVSLPARLGYTRRDETSKACSASVKVGFLGGPRMASISSSEIIFPLPNCD